MAGMIVPRFWAEGRARERRKTGQVTVRRWGWSDQSQADAQQHADSRAAADLQRIFAGEKLRRREFRVAYNGAEGVPIREEIVSRHGDTLVTRNAYGALCINTPDVLFADIDFPEGETDDVHEAPARTLVNRFVAAHPSWKVRVYRTPAGIRALALHDLFDPGSTAVDEFFKALRSDPLYVHMCVRQCCFRARVSPKPWRIGVDRHFTTAVWPVDDDHKRARDRWIGDYDKAARTYASCRYLETVGNGAEIPEVAAVRALHDDLSKATSSLPIA